MEEQRSQSSSPAKTVPELSFVVIGYNEGAHLEACLRSVRAAFPESLCCEVVYVDGGSTDESMAIAKRVGVDQVLGGDRPRRAAENRNLGLAHAQGKFVQFVDGDMVLNPTWPGAALAILQADDQVAVVFGQLRERNQTIFYQALQIDWVYPEGPALYCGGAALFRAAPLKAAGGFPEEVAYGEEPLLCWRLRNQHAATVYHLHHRMADHDLAYTGLADYWRRSVRCGETYAEIAAICKGTPEPFWSPEIQGVVRWFLVLMLLGLGIVLGPASLKAAAAALLLLILGRKSLQIVRQGYSWPVAVVYAVHTYASKISIAWGVFKWRMKRKRP